MEPTLVALAGLAGVLAGALTAWVRLGRANLSDRHLIVGEWQELVKGHSAEIAILRERLTRTDNDIAALRAENAALRAQVSALQTENASLLVRLTALLAARA